MSSTQTAIATVDAPSIIMDMAKRFGMDKRAFEATLKATVVPANVSNEQFVAFLLVAKQYNLNPITKEIYAFPAKGGGIQPIVGVDGWCNIINSNSQLDGIEFEDHMTEGKLSAITCKIFRKDRSKPTECTEYLDECKKKTEPWEKWPARMLRHKALIQCARYAFSLSGIVDPDEAERMIDVTPATATDPNTGEVVQAKESPFKTAKARKDYCQNVQDSYNAAKTLDELATLKELNKPKLDAMAISKNEHDQVGLDGMDIIYRMAEKRLMIATRETPEEEETTFDEEAEFHESVLRDSGLLPKEGLAF